jgi:hypothetical protein
MTAEAARLRHYGTALPITDWQWDLLNREILVINRVPLECGSRILLPSVTSYRHRHPNRAGDDKRIPWGASTISTNEPRSG